MSRLKAELAKRRKESDAVKHAKALAKENAQLRRIVEQFSRQYNKYRIAPRGTSNTVRFGVWSDPQIGSLYERIDAMEVFLKLCRSEKIPNILWPGDMWDGHGVYRGQEFEVYAHGFEAQSKAWSERVVPLGQGFEHYFITGNHDASFKKLANVDVGKRIEELGDNWHYLGLDSGSVTFDTKSGHKFRVLMVHPDGGTPYAISYRTQKIIEALSGGQKPDMLLIGHLHKSEWLPAYRNVHGLQAGCGQSQTPFMARKPTPAHVGGWILEAALAARKHLTSRVRGEFIAFYEEQAV